MKHKVFIAYHGTEDPKGSVKKAEKIFQFLTGYGIDCYFFPISGASEFERTPAIAAKCELFLLVANPKIREMLDEDGMLIPGGNIYNEMHEFSIKRIYHTENGKNNMKVYAYGGFTVEEADKLLTNATTGSVHWDEEQLGEEACLSRLLKWITGKTWEELDASGAAGFASKKKKTAILATHIGETLEAADDDVNREPDKDSKTDEDGEPDKGSETIEDIDARLKAFINGSKDKNDRRKASVKKPVHKKGRLKAFWENSFVRIVCFAVILSVITVSIYYTGNALRGIMTTGAADTAEPVMQVFTLYPPDDMSMEDFKNSLETLRGRLDLLVTDGEYTLQTDDENNITLEIPKSAFDYTYASVFKWYILNPINLYFGEFDENDDFINAIPLPRSAIESVEVTSDDWEDGPIFDNGEPYYLKAVLTQKYIDENGAALDALGDNIRLAQDTDYDDPPTLTVRRGSDGITFYFCDWHDNDVYKSKKYTELLQYNYTHDPLPDFFSYRVDYNTLAYWEERDNPKADLPFGEHQCNADEIDNQSVTVRLLCEQPFTEGDWINAEREIKNRLEKLQIPYAVGTYSVKDESASLFVKLPLQHTGKSIVSLLGESDYLTVRADMAQYSLSLKNSSVEIMSYDDDTYGLRVHFPTNSKAVEEFTQHLADNGGGRIYLCSSNDTRVMSRYIDTAIEGNTLDFYYQSRYDDAPDELDIYEDDYWFLEYICEVWSVDSFPYEFTTYTQNNDKDADYIHYEIPYRLSRDCYKYEITSLCKTAEVESAGPNSMTVNLHLPYDDEMPQKAMDYAKEIYSITNFETSSLEYLHILISDTDDEADEECQISFHREYRNYYDGDAFENGSIYAYGYMRGGRMTAYTDAYRSILESDPFYTDLTKTPDDWRLE